MHSAHCCSISTVPFSDSISNRPTSAHSCISPAVITTCCACGPRPDAAPATRTQSFVLKTLWFQTHWLFGITAGIVLAVVGVTGGVLSFEHELLHAMNPGVMSVTPRPIATLAPADLLAHVAEAKPGERI